MNGEFSAIRRPRGCLWIVLIVLVAAAGAYYYRQRLRQQPPVKSAPPAIAVTSSAPPPVAAPPQKDPAADLLARAKALRASDQLVEARELAWQVLDTTTNAALRKAAEDLLGEVNIELVFSPRMSPEKEEYVVQKGDSLDKLRRKFGTTVEVIRRGNRLPGDVIRAGDRLRIFKGRFSVEVSKSRNDLVLYMNDRFFKRYRVGTGRYGKTPTGEFVIKEKIPQPTWWRPDGKAIPYGSPENVLGTHWLSLNIPGYGLHGTWEPETIGTQASDGCVRLLNQDIEELFHLLPEGTPVRIIE